MTPKSKNRWEAPFSQTLSQKKEKEDAEYRAWVQSMADGTKKRMMGQRQKEQFKKIIKEFDDPRNRASTSVETLKEWIKFLEDVFRENMEWRDRDEPLQLKPNLVELQARIIEMKAYAADRARSGGIPKAAAPVKRSEVKPPALTPEQISAVYDKAREKILHAHSVILKLLSKNVRDGLSLDRARERLLAQGVSKQVVDAFNEVIEESACRFSEVEKNALKLSLLQTNRMDPFLDNLINCDPVSPDAIDL
jgi:hypothetical protein